jgi:hypothetical protein
MIQQPLPAQIQSKLEKYPFSRRPIRPRRSEITIGFNTSTYRQIIRSKLRFDMSILAEDIQFLATHPDDAKWLKHNVEPRSWSQDFRTG